MLGPAIVVRAATWRADGFDARYSAVGPPLPLHRGEPAGARPVPGRHDLARARARSTSPPCAWPATRSSASTTSRRSAGCRSAMPDASLVRRRLRRPLARPRRRHPALRHRRQLVLPADGAVDRRHHGAMGLGQAAAGRDGGHPAGPRPLGGRPGGAGPGPVPLGGRVPERDGAAVPRSHWRDRAHWAGTDYCLTASTLSSRRIFLPTSTPPVSRATFQVRPQSSRSISVWAEKPRRWPPQGSAWAPSNSTSRVTGRVTSLIGEVAGDLGRAVAAELDAGAAEGDGRVGLDVEEVGAAQVAVALLVGAVDAGGLDRDRDRGLLGRLADHELPVEVGEAPADLGDHQVPADELDGGVALVEGIGPGLGDLHTLVVPGEGDCHVELLCRPKAVYRLRVQLLS